MEMEDQYGIADLRQLMNGSRPPHLFPPTPATAAAAAIQHIPQDFYPSSSVSHHHHHHHRIPVQQQQHYEMMSMMVPRHLHDFHNDSTTPTSTNNNSSVAAAGPSTNTTVAAATSSGTLSGLENEIGCIGGGGGGGAGDGGTGRWPRQETLTLLEIRSRLDHKFKEANQKGPLWDEVSRIMSEEHGYQRSGKKCREKFENLYKYYKKTKEGKAGRQDGKHYRFFRQLEALYGETSNNVCNPLVSLSETQLLGHHHNTNVQYQVNQEPFQSQQKLYCDNSLSLSNNSSSEFESSSTDGENDMNMDDDSAEKSKRRRGRGRRSWKGKIKDFIDLQMRKLMEKQEAWLEKMMRTIESKEQERAVREGEWRKQEAVRFEREHKFWENERAWIEARDAALMDALKKLTGKEIVRSAGEVQTESENADNGGGEGGGAGGRSWVESEITRLIQLRIGMEPRFQLLQSGCDDSEEVLLWEEIANKMACLGYDNKSAIMCKEKWDSINSYLRKTNKDHECDNNNNVKNSIKNKKKRKETNSRNCSYLYQNNNNNNIDDDDDDVDDNDESLYNQGGGGGGTTTTSYCNIGGVGDAEMRLRPPHDGGGGGSSSPSHSNAAVQENCFRFLMMGGGGGENLWDNYGVKLNKGDQNP